MIQFSEKFTSDGGMRAEVHADGLPSGMYYQIQLRADGKCLAKSRAYGNGSIRYYSHRSYEEALAHGFQWAKRKVAEAKRAPRPGT